MASGHIKALHQDLRKGLEKEGKLHTCTTLDGKINILTLSFFCCCRKRVTVTLMSKMTQTLTAKDVLLQCQAGMHCHTKLIKVLRKIYNTVSTAA